MYYIRIITLFLISSFTLFSTKAQIIDFTDAMFLNAVLKDTVDTDKSGDISEAEAAAVIRLDVDSSMISDLSELHYFSNIKILSASNNNLTQIDLSNLASLEELYLSKNTIESLDFTPTPLIKIINVDFNPLSTFDFTNLIHLETISGEDVHLDSLVSHASYPMSLTTILWNFASVKHIDLSYNQQLNSLLISWYNKDIESLNLSYCDQLEKITVYGTAVYQYILEGDTNLLEFILNDVMPSNKYKTHFAETFYDAKNLETIVVSNLADSIISIDTLKKLKRLGITDNPPSQVRFEAINHPQLQYIDVNTDSLFISDCPEFLGASGKIKSFNVNSCDKFVSISSSDMVKLRLTNLPSLTTIPLGWFPDYASTIKELVIKNCDSLGVISMSWYSSRIEKAIIEDNQLLKEVRLQGSGIQKIDLSSNPAIETIYLSHSLLTGFDASVFPNLITLNINTNPHIPYLDFNFDHSLEYLNVSGMDSSFYICMNDTSSLSQMTFIKDSITPIISCVLNLYPTDFAKEPKEILRAYNVLGQPVSPYKEGEVLIIEFKDGTREKWFR